MSYRTILPLIVAVITFAIPAAASAQAYLWSGSVGGTESQYLASFRNNVVNDAYAHGYAVYPNCQPDAPCEYNAFAYGWPDYFFAGNWSQAPNFGTMTADHLCQLINGDSTARAANVSASDSSHHGGDWEYDNNLVWNGSQWFLLDAGHHYFGYPFYGKSASDWYISYMTCYTYQPPQNTLSVNTNEITQGDSVLVSWNDPGGTDSCSASGFTPTTHQVYIPGDCGDWEYDESGYSYCAWYSDGYYMDVPDSSGSTWVTPSGSTTYQYSCSNGNGSNTASQYVQVDAAIPQPCQSAPNSCGQQSAGVITGGVCSAATPSESGCPAPTASISVLPTPIRGPGASNPFTVTWSSTGASSCSVYYRYYGGSYSDGSPGWNHEFDGTSGSRSDTDSSLPAQYLLSCSNPGGTTNAYTTQSQDPAYLPDLTADVVYPTTVTAGIGNLYSNIWNYGGGTASNFTNVLRVTGLPNTGQYGGNISSLAPNAYVVAGFNNPITTAGTYQVSVCADNDVNWNGSVTENNEGNNCGPWTTITVVPQTPSCTNLTSAPSSINPGQTVTLTWSCSNASSCSAVTNADGFSTGGSISGSTTAKPSQLGGDEIYGMTCVGPGANKDFYFPPVTIIVPSVYITASPTRVSSNSSTTLAFSADNVTGCTITGTDGYSWSSGAVGTIATTTVSRTVTTQTTYTLNCTSKGNPAKSSVVVNVVPIQKNL